MPGSPLEVVGSFISAINCLDMKALRSLMTEDHIFTDSRGAKFFGAEQMFENWKCFLDAHPQYWISISDHLVEGNRVALFGEMGGRWRVDGQTLPGSWEAPAAWLGEVDGGRVRRWSIFCDSEWSRPPQLQEELVGANYSESR